MNKTTIITIAGKPGSGKSTTGKLLAQRLGYTHTSTGDFMRTMAKERGMTLDELTKLSETDATIDTILDEHNVEIGQGTNIVIDSRLGFHFIPDSFKVFLDIDHRVAAERIFKNMHDNHHRKNEAEGDNFNSTESIAASITNRLASERQRYYTMYNIKDHTAAENFNIVIHTDAPEFTNNVDAVVQTIVDAYTKWQAQ